MKLNLQTDRCDWTQNASDLPDSLDNVEAGPPRCCQLNGPFTKQIVAKRSGKTLQHLNMESNHRHGVTDIMRERGPEL
jgi:hypothetical protein